MSVTAIDLKCDWACGLNINLNSKLLCIICVYLPYECDKNYDEYISCLEQLRLFVDDSDTTSDFILGDFNCDLRKQSAFSK